MIEDGPSDRSFTAYSSPSGRKDVQIEEESNEIFFRGGAGYKHEIKAHVVSKDGSNRRVVSLIERFFKSRSAQDLVNN